MSWAEDSSSTVLVSERSIAISAPVEAIIISLDRNGRDVAVCRLWVDISMNKTQCFTVPEQISADCIIRFRVSMQYTI